MVICHFMERWFAHLTPMLEGSLCWACWAHSSLKVLLGSFLQLVESSLSSLVCQPKSDALSSLLSGFKESYGQLRKAQ
jgi:hypothetical protein